jgi:hypothetical protein
LNSELEALKKTRQKYMDMYTDDLIYGSVELERMICIKLNMTMKAPFNEGVFLLSKRRKRRKEQYSATIAGCFFFQPGKCNFKRIRRYKSEKRKTTLSAFSEQKRRQLQAYLDFSVSDANYSRYVLLASIIVKVKTLAAATSFFKMYFRNLLSYNKYKIKRLR